MSLHPGFGLKGPERSDPTSPRQYPFVRWDVLAPKIQWEQGQHVLAVGGTGSGKSTLMGVMLPRRRLVVVFVSKGYDETLSGPLFRGYETIRSWPPKRRRLSNSKQVEYVHEKVLLWPPNGEDVRETRAIKQETFRKASNDILLHVGHWCVAFDEVHYMADSLKLEPEVVDLEEQGRSYYISLWANTQRPANIPIACYTNAAHAFFFLTQEEYDTRRLGQIRNKFTNPKELMFNIERLDPHEFVYIDRSGRVPPCRSIVER